jgi:hypothetical protein
MRTETLAVQITVGGSNKLWWSAAQEAVEAGTAPAALLPLLTGLEGEVTVDSETWQAAWAWAHGMDGWVESDGTEQLTAEFDDEH